MINVNDEKAHSHPLSKGKEFKLIRHTSIFIAETVHMLVINFNKIGPSYNRHNPNHSWYKQMINGICTRTTEAHTCTRKKMNNKKNICLHYTMHASIKYTVLHNFILFLCILFHILIVDYSGHHASTIFQLFIFWPFTRCMHVNLLLKMGIINTFDHIILYASVFLLEKKGALNTCSTFVQL